MPPLRSLRLSYLFLYLIDCPENVPMLQVYRDSHFPASLPKLLLNKGIIQLPGDIHLENLDILRLLTDCGDLRGQVGDIDSPLGQYLRDPIDQAWPIFSPHG